MSGGKRILFGKQLVNDVFDPLVDCGTLPVEFSLPPKSHIAILVNHVNGGPHGVRPSVPIAVLEVDEHGEFEPSVLSGVLNFLDIAFRLSFWRLNSNDANAAFGQLLVPTSVVPEIGDTVMA